MARLEITNIIKQATPEEKERLMKMYGEQQHIRDLLRNDKEDQLLQVTDKLVERVYEAELRASSAEAELIRENSRLQIALASIRSIIPKKPNVS